MAKADWVEHRIEQVEDTTHGRKWANGRVELEWRHPAGYVITFGWEWVGRMRRLGWRLREPDDTTDPKLYPSIDSAMRAAAKRLRTVKGDNARPVSATEQARIDAMRAAGERRRAVATLDEDFGDDEPN